MRSRCTSRLLVATACYHFTSYQVTLYYSCLARRCRVLYLAYLANTMPYPSPKAIARKLRYALNTNCKFMKFVYVALLIDSRVCGCFWKIRSEMECGHDTGMHLSEIFYLEIIPGLRRSWNDARTWAISCTDSALQYKLRYRSRHWFRKPVILCAEQLEWGSLLLNDFNLWGIFVFQSILMVKFLNNFNLRQV